MVLLAKDVDVSKISVAKPVVLDNGAKLIYVNYDGQKKFKIQTPKMSSPFGMSEYTEGPYPKYSIELSFRESDSTDPKDKRNNQKIKQFHDKLLEVENRLIELACENGTAWFKMPKNKINHEIISSKFLPPIVKVSRDRESGEPDGKYPPTTKLKIYCKDDKWGLRLFDINNPSEVIDVNDPEGPDIKQVLGRNVRMKGIITCVGIWIGSGTFMCQWALSEAQVDVPEISSNDQFINDEDDEVFEEDEEQSNGPTMLEDSDDDAEAEAEPEAEAEAEPEPEPTPTPSKPKKLVKKKLKKAST